MQRKRGPPGRLPDAGNQLRLPDAISLFSQKSVVAGVAYLKYPGRSMQRPYNTASHPGQSIMSTRPEGHPTTPWRDRRAQHAAPLQHDTTSGTVDSPRPAGAPRPNAGAACSAPTTRHHVHDSRSILTRPEGPPTTR